VQTTIFTLVGDRIDTTVNATPEWKPFDEFEGKPLYRVRLVELLTASSAEVQLVEIAAGGRFAMHSSPKMAFCQVVRGKGKLGLPDGRELAYEGPELYVFLPNTLHDWHDIERDTLLSVCLIGTEQG
jgi:quercetin dioxygenase-like cupin family protein